MASLSQAAGGMNRLEELAMTDSPVHRLHPIVKLITTVVYIVTVISFPYSSVSGLVPFLFYPAVLMALSETPYKPLLQRLLVALPFALMGGISNLIFMRETAFVFGSLVITAGEVSFISILLKTLLTVLSVLILAATTSFIDLSYQLRLLRVPKILCLQLVMTYRYLSVLLGEAGTMYMAYTLRSADQKGIRMKDMGFFLGQLILRSFDRADRVYEAMKCRGFDGVFYGRTTSSLRFADLAYTVCVVLLIIAFRFFNLSLFFGSLVS